MLELCLNFVNDRIDKMNEEFDIERQQLIDENNKNVHFMEDDLNKFAHDNEEQRAIIEELERENEHLRNRIKEFESRFNDVSRKSDSDVNDINNYRREN